MKHGNQEAYCGVPFPHGLDGPEMDNDNEVKHAHQERTISIDPDLFDSIRTVDWTGEC